MRRFVSVMLMILLPTLVGCSLSSSTSEGPPVVSLADGIGSAPYRAGVVVHLQASVQDAGPGVEQVDFRVDGELVGTVDAPDEAQTFTVSYPWMADASGSRVVQVSAARDGGARGEDSQMLTVVERDSSATATPATSAGATATPGSQATAPQQGMPTATATLRPTLTPPPTNTATPQGAPQAVFDRNQNARTGPGLNFTRLGTFAPGDQTTILAVSVDGSWYRVRFQAGEAWVYAPLVDTQGSVAGLPREVGPPTPTPMPTDIPTAAPPPTATSAPSVNLVIDSFTINVPSDGSVQPKCNVPFVARMTVRNAGGTASSTGMLRIENRYLGNNTVNGSSGNALVPVQLQPGGTHTVEYTFTISTNYAEQHRVVFIVDANNEVPESNENDNTNGITYTLERAGC